MRFASFCLVFAAAVVSTSLRAEDVPGFARVSAPQKERGQTLSVALFYPASGGTSSLQLGENEVFYGVPVGDLTPPKPGRHPLVLLSHGSGGRAENLAWVATRLAQAGFIVAAPNHPGTTSGDSTPAFTMRMWERPADLSAVLDRLLSDPIWSTHIDAQKIGAVGFSLGGYTVLASAGLRYDAAAYAHYCDTNPKMTDCVWMRSDGTDLHELDDPRIAASHEDKRIKAVVAVDPGPVPGFVMASAADIHVPVTLINQGRPSQGTSLSDGLIAPIDARQLATQIPGAAYHDVPDALHLSFLGVCKPDAAKVLADEGENEPICQDGGDRPRTEIHQEEADVIVNAFKQDFAGM